MSRAQIFFKKEKKIFCFGFLRKQKGGSGAINFYFSLFISLAASVPPIPTLAAGRNSLYFAEVA